MEAGETNPQQFITIPTSSNDDFQKAIIRVYHDARYPLAIVLPIVNNQN